MSSFSCVADIGSGPHQTRATIGRDGIDLAGQPPTQISFADLMDMRLINYRLRFELREGEAVISQLGYQTEEFFEQAWLAYARKSRDALFAEGAPAMSSEGDYAYREDGYEAHGIAKLEVHEDCVCVYPHDVGARRIPLCFTQSLEREGFSMTMVLDTGESYRCARLGRDTDGFFDRVKSARKRTMDRWQRAHRELERNLEARLGDVANRYHAFEDTGDHAFVGLFSPDDDGFWFATLRRGRAAVELVTNEDTATYLYDYDTSDEEFELRLRHAMEAVGRNRRVIYLGDDELDAIPLYRMSVDRSSHVRFLRRCNAGRIIHTKAWQSRLSDFLS